MARLRRTPRLDRSERRRLGGLAAAVAFLHLLGWGLFAHYARSQPALAGLGTLAYALGLRHAFDADHIAAIDNATRRLLARGERPLGAGFCFSVGHASVVFGLTVALALAARTVEARLPALEGYGGTVGAGVSGLVLCVIGVLNLLVLLDVVRRFLRMRSGGDDAAHPVAAGGLLCRLGAGRLLGLVTRSWHMLPLGFLFGLGFDTATEVGLLAVAVGAASQQAPILSILALPLLFAAGMSLLDTADGAFMAHAYGWAFASPVRRAYYDITVTALSVVVALGVGTIELAQVAAARLHVWSGLQALDFGRLGYGVAALFVATWLLAAGIWKGGRIEQRFAARTGGG